MCHHNWWSNNRLFRKKGILIQHEIKLIDASRCLWFVMMMVCTSVVDIVIVFDCPKFSRKICFQAIVPTPYRHSVGGTVMHNVQPNPLSQIFREWTCHFEYISTSQLYKQAYTRTFVFYEFPKMRTSHISTNYCYNDLKFSHFRRPWNRMLTWTKSLFTSCYHRKLSIAAKLA
jgi:hypothetical protein